MANLKTKVTNFLKGYNNAKATATEVILDAVLHWSAHGDWEELARAYAGVDTLMQKSMRKVIKKIAPNATLKKNDDARFGYTFSKVSKDGSLIDHEACEELTQIIASVDVKHNIDGPAIKSWLGEEEDKKKEFVLRDYAKTIAKRLEQNGESLDALIAALQALRGK